MYNVISPSKPKMLAPVNTGAIRIGMAIGIMIVAILAAIA